MNVSPWLDKAEVPLRPFEFKVLCLAGFCAFGSVAWRAYGPVAGIVLAAVGGCLPLVWLRHRIRARVRLFDSQVEDVVAHLAASLDGGRTTLQAMDAVGREFSPPAATLFRRCTREYALGVPLEATLSRLAGTSARSARLAQAMLLQREQGGNLLPIWNECAGATASGDGSGCGGPAAGDAGGDTGGWDLFERVVLEANEQTLKHMEALRDAPVEEHRAIVTQCMRRVFDGLVEARKLPAHDEQLLQDVMDEVLGLGPVERLLREPEITRIDIRGARDVWVTKAGGECRAETAFLDEAHLLRTIRKVSDSTGRSINRSSPVLQDVPLRDPRWRMSASIVPASAEGPRMTLWRAAP